MLSWYLVEEVESCSESEDQVNWLEVTVREVGSHLEWNINRWLFEPSNYIPHTVSSADPS